jgi:hypothetical protein
MPKKEWKKAQSVGHATTRIVFINTDLVREIIPDADAKTPIVSKCEVTELDTNPPSKALVIHLKKGEPK